MQGTDCHILSAIQPSRYKRRVHPKAIRNILLIYSASFVSLSIGRPDLTKEIMHKVIPLLR